MPRKILVVGNDPTALRKICSFLVEQKTFNEDLVTFFKGEATLGNAPKIAAMALNEIKKRSYDALIIVDPFVAIEIGPNNVRFAVFFTGKDDYMDHQWLSKEIDKCR